MSWLGLVIGFGTAAVFLGLVFLILWLFPDNDKRPRPVKRPKKETTLCHYQLQAEADLQIKPASEVKARHRRAAADDGVLLKRSRLEVIREDESRRSSVPGMDPASNHVDGSCTLVIEVEGEEILTNVRIREEGSISAILQFDGPDQGIPHLRNGNLTDVGKAGSLHQFLMKLHKEFGPVASFWWGTEYTVSIASPELFKQHQHLFDRPADLFRMFEPFITKHSIQFANGMDGKTRRQAFDKVFNYDRLDIYYDKLQKIADEIVGKWAHAEADDHFPLGEHMFLFAVKAALLALMGDNFKDDKEALAFKNSYDMVWEDMERRLTDPVLPKEDSPRAQNFKSAVQTMKEIIARAVQERQSHGQESHDFLLLDAIITHHTDEDHRFADAITYMVGGFHTTGNLLTWCIYFLSLHEDVQEKLHSEILAVLGADRPLNHQSFGQLTYLRQVLDETLRCAVVAPWAARYSQQETELGGHKIPAGTPVIHALGVTMMDETIWPAPTVFDPERFSEKKSKGRPTIAFSPFGFAGRRQCPAYRFAYVEASILLVTALQRFKFLLVPGQEVKPQHGLVTHPKEEIWFKVASRA